MKIVRGYAHEFIFIFVELAEFLPVSKDGVTGVLQLQVGPDPGEQFGQIERFGHVIDRSHLEALNQVLVWSEYSCGISVIKFQEAVEALASL